jgi:hypothetical protein
MPDDNKSTLVVARRLIDDKTTGNERRGPKNSLHDVGSHL